MFCYSRCSLRAFCGRVDAGDSKLVAILSSVKRIWLTTHRWYGRLIIKQSDSILLDFPLRFRFCLNVCLKARACSCLFIQRIGSD
jgi:hypothetical protein